MNFLDMENLDKNIQTTSKIKKYIENLGYRSGGHIDGYIYRTTKYCLNSSVARISIQKNFCDKIKHLVLRNNGKIKSWWFDIKECYKVAICFDDFMMKNHKETDWTTFFNVNINKYVKEFWQQITYENIMNIPDQWFFDRAYFYMQTDDCLKSGLYQRPKMFTKEEFKIFDKRDFEYTDIIKIDDDTIHSNLDEIFGEDKVWEMANNRLKLGC